VIPTAPAEVLSPRYGESNKQQTGPPIIEGAPTSDVIVAAATFSIFADEALWIQDFL
jgi:hypothetical protein